MSAHLVLSAPVVVSTPFAAVRLRVSGIELSPESSVIVALDDRPTSGALRRVSNGQPFELDIPLRLVPAGTHRLAIVLTSVRGQIKYKGDGRADFTLSEGQPVKGARIADASRDITYSIDDVFDGSQIHVVAAGQAGHDVRLTFGPAANIAVDGWAATTAHALPSAVLFRIDGGPVRSVDLGDARPDVAKAFSAAALERAGFTARFSTRSLRAGEHSIEFFVAPQRVSTTERTAPPLRFHVAGT